MCGSQSELLAQGVDPKQLLGLISHTDVKEERDQFSVNLQDDGTCTYGLLASTFSLPIVSYNRSRSFAWLSFSPSRLSISSQTSQPFSSQAPKR